MRLPEGNGLIAEIMAHIIWLSRVAGASFLGTWGIQPV